MDFLTAKRGFAEVTVQMEGARRLSLQGRRFGGLRRRRPGVDQAPRILGVPIIADLPALGIVFVITALVYIGIRESKRASNIMVAVKLAVIVLVIVLGAFYVNTANWSPFVPNGLSGVMNGVAAVFFAYIGFDAISTTAEECKDPYKTCRAA